MTNAARELTSLGQSIWLDDINREYLQSGLFQHLISEEGVTGATGNPTIFEHAIDHGTAYDEQMRPLLAQSMDAQAIYETLAMTDVQQVADLLRPIYNQTDGQDGFVSIEVSPALAYETERTLVEVRRFWKTIDRPNLMVKIPATPAGIPAIRQALSEGININITLMFSLSHYQQVAEAYQSALEERSTHGLDLHHIASVASFFVSRIDVLVDRLLQERLQATADPAEQAAIKSLLGKTAIANARLAYQEFKRCFKAPRFATLKQQGARVQRPLWASTGTKNPAYRDVLYVETLIGPDTVNTMPLATLERLREHGQVRLSIEDDLQAAQTHLATLATLSIDYDQVTQQLQVEGIQKFLDSFQTLFACIDNKRQRR